MKEIKMNLFNNIIITIIVIISSPPSWYRSLLPIKSKTCINLMQVFFINIF